MPEISLVIPRYNRRAIPTEALRRGGRAGRAAPERSKAGEGGA